MGNLLTRRRELILASGIDCPYIKNGLVFWLDGLNRGGVTGEWEDLIAGKVFTLTNCTEYSNRVTFNGSTSYGEAAGGVWYDQANATIEVAISNTAEKTAVFIHPSNGNNYGLSLFFGTNNSMQTVCANTSYQGTVFKPGYTKKTYSGTMTSCVAGKTQITNTAGKANWAVNSTGKMLLGKRANGTYFLGGSIYGVRIYNRKLSVSEMKANQAVDFARYGF